MQSHSARGHLWMLTLLGESLSLVRLTPSRLGQRAPGGWTQRVVPVSTIRGVELTPPTLLRRGRLTLHLDVPAREHNGTETIRYERSQHDAVRALVAALRASLPPVHADHADRQG